MLKVRFPPQFFIGIAVVCSHIMLSAYYQYPVAYRDNQLYVLSQTFLERTILELWDLDTGNKELLIQPPYSAASISLIPDSQAFSFIDNGRVRIKRYETQEPETITFTMPIYDISIVHWIDAHTFYCSAKKRMRYGIFEVADNGHVEQLLYSIATDYLYPNKKESFLFYIERSDTQDGFHYEIIKNGYKIKSDSELIADFGSRPIAFLSMITPCEGFVLEYHQNADTCANFICHHLKRVDDQWVSEQLFTFMLPNKFFDRHSKECFYESFLPFRPQYINDTIYYVSQGPTGINAYMYSIAHKTSTKISNFKTDEILCGLLLTGNFLLCGGSQGIIKLT